MKLPSAALKLVALCLLAAAPARATSPVATYHNDNLRTGWINTETVLTPANVASSSFGLLSTVSVDESMDAQPLFLPAQTIAGAQHDVVYAATENNTIYAIDALTGTTLLSRNLGTPVSQQSLPGQCSNNSGNVGITSTPVIDSANGIIYVMTYTSESGQAVFRLHALDTATLADRIPNVIVAATAQLIGGSTATFAANYERQRAALLFSSGNIYAGFASYCDYGANVSRGWLLGWNASTLAKLPRGELVNHFATSPNTYFMGAIWMSGYGPAADSNGDVWFASSNADPSGKSYNAHDSLPESVIRMSADLSTVKGHFIPGNYATMDAYDGDFGAGGVLLLPSLGSAPNLAVAAGKMNGVYLLNRDLFTATAKPFSQSLGQYPNAGCWCGQSYYMGTYGVGHVVTSVGDTIVDYHLRATAQPGLVKNSESPALGGGQDGGFFTTISSNGTQPNTYVIWAVPHPADSDSNHTLILKAFDPAQGLAQIFSAPAGNWPYASNSDSNIVPIVADGHVFVPTYGSLAIFGLSTTPAHATPHMAIRAADTRVVPGHVLHGTLVARTGNLLTVRLRDGRLLHADATQAEKAFRLAEIAPGHGVMLRGASYTPDGAFAATLVMHTKDSPLLWDPDR